MSRPPQPETELEQIDILPDIHTANDAAALAETAPLQAGTPPRQPARAPLDTAPPFPAAYAADAAPRPSENIPWDREILLREVLEVLPVGVFIVDRDGRIVHANPSGEKIWGGVRHVGPESYGEYKGWWADSGDPVAPEEWAVLRAISRGETSVGEEIRIEGFDGTRKTILNSASPLRDREKKITGAVAVVQDITAIRRAQGELSFSKGFFKSSFDSAAAGVVVSDAMERSFLMANRAFCEIVGYSEYELLGMYFQDLTHPDDRARDVETARRLLAGELAPYIQEKRYLHKSGEVVWVLVAVALIYGQDGEPMYFVGQVIDITARKQMENELISSREKLRRVATYETSAREAERKRIARELHDELGQMLTGIKMDLSSLHRSLPPSPGLAERIRGTQHLLDGALASVRRIASDLRPYMLDELGLESALEWMVQEFEKRCGGISCSLAFRVDDGYSPDADIVITTYRIVQECLTNVARHADATRVDIDIGLHADGAFLISIRDNGRGLPEAAKHDGLGLQGIRERVIALNGKLKLHSRPYEGVALEVAIPVAWPQAATACAGAHS